VAAIKAAIDGLSISHLSSGFDNGSSLPNASPGRYGRAAFRVGRGSAARGELLPRVANMSACVLIAFQSDGIMRPWIERSVRMRTKIPVRCPRSDG
jgi:hypothetical protein